MAKKKKEPLKIQMTLKQLEEIYEWATNFRDTDFDEAWADADDNKHWVILEQPDTDTSDGPTQIKAQVSVKYTGHAWDIKEFS